MMIKILNLYLKKKFIVLLKSYQMRLKKDKKRPLKSKCKTPEKEIYSSIGDANIAANILNSRVIFGTKIEAYPSYQYFHHQLLQQVLYL